MILAKGTAGIESAPLATVPEKARYMIDRVSGPEQQQRRLCEMGFVEGARLQVLSRSREGMMVVKLGGSRLALARGMADYVFVK